MITYSDQTGGLIEVKPGMFGLSRIGGLLGKLIAAGQAFSGDGSRWTHAFIVLDDETVIEAMPGGARIVPIGDRLKHEEIAFSDGPVAEHMEAYRATYGPEQGYTDPEAFYGYVERINRERVVDEARALEGVGYGYLQYVLLGLLAVGIDWKWLRNRVARKDRMICSQLVDEVYRRSGIQLFDDGRLSQDVTPGDLAIRYAIA